MPNVTVNDITISYTLHNPPQAATALKPTVLLINGLADTKETWQLQLPTLLSAGHPVLTFDNRGIGASSRPLTPYTAELLASDTKTLVDALNIPKPFHILGVSMGGMIAQSYALSYPEDVRGLILACTYAKPNLFCTRRFEYWADVAKSMDVATVMRDVASWGFTQAFFEPEHAEDLKEFDDAMKELDLSVEEYLCQLNVIQLFDSTRDVGRLRELKGRVMVLAGEEDILIPTALSREMVEMIEGSEWKEVKGGHCCLWELPEDFNRAVVEFLGKNSG